MTDSFSPKAFQRKIDAFCQLRLSPLLAADELAQLMNYMHSLIQTRRPAPRVGGRTRLEQCGSGLQSRRQAPCRKCAANRTRSGCHCSLDQGYGSSQQFVAGQSFQTPEGLAEKGSAGGS
ncbi:hypothetical protein NKY66_09575 [Sinorhizobium meliloti]|uniref:hypothetical protein n=1 Tax=Rhizobium meliloti TaxID=382 RepID=UPI003D647448